MEKTNKKIKNKKSQKKHKNGKKWKIKNL